MRSFRSGLVLSFLIPGCYAPENRIQTYTAIELTNPTSMVREHEIVEIPLSTVRARYASFDVNRFSVHLLSKNWYSDRDPMLATDPPPEIPAQLIDRNGDGTPEAILALVDFNAGEQRPIAVASPPFSSYAKKSGPNVGGGLFVRETTTRHEGGAINSAGAYVRVAAAVLDAAHAKGDGLYQYGGPVFETDEVAWRLLFDSRLAFDVLGKRERKMVLQQPGNAPLDLGSAPWGGSLLGEPEQFGAGMLCGIENGTAVPMAGCSSVQYRMVANGPAALEAELLILGARFGADTCDLSWRITQTGGSHALRHDVTVLRGTHHLAFVMNARGVRKELPSGRLGWLRVSSYGPANVTGSVGGSLGLGIVADARISSGFVANPTDVMGVTFDPIVRRMTFFSVAAWDGEPAPTGVRSEGDFQKMLDDLAVRLNEPIRTFNLEMKAGS